MPISQISRKAKTPGDIVIPYGASPETHEMEIAQILALTGHDVEFIPVRLVPTPDIYYLGKEWEVKSPTGSSGRTIENNLRNALQQSPNIIIDLRRIKIPETNCLRELRRQSKKIKQIQNLLAITKDRKIVDIYSKSR